MADLSALRELHAWMREANVLYARSGELELRLLPMPPASAPLDEPATGEDDERRLHLETLLYSSGGDASPFMPRRRAG